MPRDRRTNPSRTWPYFPGGRLNKRKRVALAKRRLKKRKLKARAGASR